MRAKLVKFDDDGTQCKRDIEYLRRHPECGIPFIQDKPFKPVNPKPINPKPINPKPINPKPINPKPKFRPHDRNFNINILDRATPSDPDIPPAPPIGQSTLQATAIDGTPYTNQYLPQDYTNKYDLGGKRILAETPHGHSVDEYVTNKIVNSFNKSGYGIVPRIGNDSYSHETPERFTRPVGEVELEDFGAGVGIPNDRPPPTLRTTRIRPVGEVELEDFGAGVGIPNDRPPTLRTTRIRPVGEVELEDFGAGVGIPNDRPPTLRTTRIRPVADPRDTEFATTEKLNLADLPDEIKILIAEKINVRDITNRELLELEGNEVENVGKINLEDEKIIKEIIKEVDNAIENFKEDTENFDEDALEENIELKNKLEEHLKKLQKTQRFRNVIKKSLPLKPRGMTDEELIDAQIEQLTRNSTQEEAKLIESQIKAQTRRTTLPKRRVPVSEIEGTELVAIEPEKEETLITREAERFTRAGRPKISQREAEQIADKFLQKGISRSRTLQILEEFNLYDAQGEFELQAIADPNERAMIRRMRAQRIIEAERRDTNLLPERQQEIELRADTPLTRGRGRVEKVYDRVAGKLPEELRTLAGSVKRNAEAFNENVRTRSLEAIQRVQSTSTRVFGQKYTGIRETALELRGGDIELLAPEGNINIRPPATEDITGLRAGDLQALDFDPLGADYQETFIGGAKPKLTYSERLQSVKTGALIREVGVGGAGAVGGVLIGFGVAELMGRAGVDNKYAIAATAGGAGGVGARILTMAGSRALTRGGATTVAEGASYAAIRGGTSLLRGAAEGAVIGLIAMPIDMALNESFVNHGMSHTGANLASGALVGGGATALTTIGLASLGASGATLGASLIVGGIAMGVTSLIGFFAGQEQDKQEKLIKEAEIARIHLNTTSKAREKLLITLPKFNYNFVDALNAFPYKTELGTDDDTWSSFSSNVGNMFKPRPTNNPLPVTPSSEPPTEEQKRVSDLFNQYVTRRLIYKVCSGDTGCEELRRHDKGELTNEEVEFLEEKTGGTWRNSANMQVEMSVQELNYTRKRMGDAQTEMLNAWNNEQKVANQLDPYIVQTASLDPTFRQRYDLAIKLDAQQRVVDAYQTDQTRIEQLPKNVRDTANTDPEFNSMIHQYYESIETTAGQLDISVPQLIELQGLEGETQKDKYEEFQFNNIKQNQTIVSEAKEISSEEDQVREAGFYDIDQAFLETDPTAIHTWHPTDSQILQAHSAGMTLNEYVNYMHELAKGEAGDFTKLPKYNEEQLRASGMLDYTHFVDELQVAGYRKDLYLYNPETRQFTLNPNVTNSAIPSTQAIIHLSLYSKIFITSKTRICRYDTRT
jgi:hypothetical protein